MISIDFINRKNAIASKVAKVKWWMQHYGSKTAKRHYGYGNSSVILKLDLGKLYAHQRPPKEERVKTADHYRDKKGVLRYKGNRNLKATENLVHHLDMFIDGACLFCFTVVMFSPCVFPLNKSTLFC